MFGRSNNESTTVSEYIEKKSRLIQKKKKMFRAKIKYALHGEHQHYFGKHDVKEHGQDACCKVCGITLSEFRVQRRFENWSPNLKPIHRHQKSSNKGLPVQHVEGTGENNC